MKKYFLTIIISLLVGFLLSYYILKEYDDTVMPAFLTGETVYLIEQGAYSSYDNMISNTTNINNYVYSTKDNMYYVYVGMTLSKDNASKIQGIYEFATTIETIEINDADFINTLQSTDSIISATNDSKTITEACKQALSKYKEN